MHVATAPRPVLAPPAWTDRLPGRRLPAAGYRELFAAEVPARRRGTVQLLLAASASSPRAR